MDKDKQPFQPSPSEHASNPNPDRESGEQGETLFGEKAAKYFKESAPIEDMPDPEEDQEAIDQMKEDKTPSE